MARIFPNSPAGPSLPRRKPARSAKKETVRINLAAKPTAARRSNSPPCAPGVRRAPRRRQRRQRPLRLRSAAAPGRAPHFGGAPGFPAGRAHRRPRRAPLPRPRTNRDGLDSDSPAAAIIGLLAVGTTLYFAVRHPVGWINFPKIIYGSPAIVTLTQITLMNRC